MKIRLEVFWILVLLCATCAQAGPGGGGRRGKKKGGKPKGGEQTTNPGPGRGNGRHNNDRGSSDVVSTTIMPSTTTSATTTSMPTPRPNRPVKTSKFNDNMNRNGPMPDTRTNDRRLQPGSNRRGFDRTAQRGGDNGGQGGVAQTRQVNGNQLSPEMRDVFLNAHNDFRRVVSPSAANMIQLNWDVTLAEMAQNWADRCTFAHGNPDNISPYSWVGQNIWAGSGTGWDHYGMIQDWYDEVDDYDYDSNSCTGVCGHYTQLVWAETSHVGCAIATCTTLQGLGWSPATILVCNYGQGGNYQGVKPYVRGQTCSQCPPEYPICLDNALCASSDAGTNPGSGSDTGTGSESGTAPESETGSENDNGSPGPGPNNNNNNGECGGVLTSSEGTFTSPGWSTPYDINTHCQWIIKGKSGDKVTLTFTYLDIEEGNSCPWDYVKVQQTLEDPGMKYCGMQTPPPITSEGRTLLVTFHSDYSVTRGGFSASYKIEGSQEQDGCGGTVVGNKGTITSPGYPEAYPANQDCVWTIRVPKNRRVSVWFVDFEVEDHVSCSYDFLTMTLGDERIPMTLCGADVSSGQYTSIGREVQLRFKSDHVTGRRGFNLQFKAVR